MRCAHIFFARCDAAQNTHHQFVSSPCSISWFVCAPTVDPSIAARDRRFPVTCRWYLRELELRTIVYTGNTNDCSIGKTHDTNFCGAMLVPILITKDKNFTRLIEAVSPAGPQIIAVSSPAIHRGIARGIQSFSRSLHHGCQEEGCKEEGRAEEEGREEEVVFASKHRGEPAQAGSPLFFLVG